MRKIKTESDELRPEYQREDFGDMARGKYAGRCREASNVVVLSPDVQKAFPNAQAVNDALRGLLELTQASVKTTPTTRTPRKRAAS
ncbi:hypothetical protein [Propionivibrio sp.]|uniref:hypothetical protein n=1 Tax=Propionivibrio sp. TaxID=2212460 RepID=UPI003BF1BA35